MPAEISLNNALISLKLISDHVFDLVTVAHLAAQMLQMQRKTVAQQAFYRDSPRPS